MTKLSLTKSKKIILSAMLLSILIVLSRFFSIKSSFLVISFSFIPMMLAGIYLGPKYAAIIAGLGDLIGAILFPFGAYFPGFTISSALMGFVYGIFLYKKPEENRKDFKFIIQLIISSILVLGGIKILLESVFLNVLYGKAYLAIIASRLVTELIMIPVQVITIFILEKALRPFTKKYLYKEEKVGIDEYLDTFDKFTKDPNLDAMKYIMDKFNNPEKQTKFIHVSGTNGKGSICEMLAKVLDNTEYKVGKFISPHLIRFNDGIWINDKQITDEEVEEIMLPLSEVITEYNKMHEVPVKWFEAITSLAIIYFAKQKCDLAILEVGLGGLDDCTNIVDGEIAVIGNIGYDHVDILGNNIADIAKHKAGIIKQNSDTVIFKQEQIMEVIEEECKNKNSKLHVIGIEDITNYSNKGELQKFDYKTYKNVEINLKGRCQTYNACEVLEAINILKGKGFKISDEAIYNGLKTVIHRARLEVLSKNPLVIFDGGHNENAIKNLEENIKEYYQDNKRVYIVSILNTKDYKTIIKNICQDKNAIFFFTSGNNKTRYVSKNKLYKEAKKYLNDVNMYKEEFEDALDICMKVYNDRTILVIGSFYVYKDAIKYLEDKIIND
ncbi:MAG: folate family ECF transporter S component [Clostridia bacterium]|nr:folate family ECF transporter S component [Clostridia bacterium]